jgi:hypothetical protein
MSDLMELDPPDAIDQSAKQWRARFQTLFLHKLDAIFEIAQNIKEFHDEFNLNPTKWPDTLQKNCRCPSFYCFSARNNPRRSSQIHTGIFGCFTG